MQNIADKKFLNEYVEAAINSYPFYKWFYKGINHNQLDYSELPIMTKSDLIKYKLETNKEFYTDTKNTQFENFYTTTGTSGLILKFPYIKGEMGSLNNFANELNYFNNKIFFENIGIFQIYPNDINFLQTTLCSVLSSRKPIVLEADKSNSLRDIFNKSNIDTILDPTSEFAISLIKDNITSDITSLSNIIVLYIDKVNFRKLRDLGFNIISIFACMEFGFLGFKINNEDPNVLSQNICHKVDLK